MRRDTTQDSAATGNLTLPTESRLTAAFLFVQTLARIKHLSERM